MLDIRYTFELDQLPVSSLQLLNSGTNKEDAYNLLNQAISQLVSLIREAGVHRFRQLSVDKHSIPVYYYYCSQDTFWDKNTESASQRDRCQMDRFDCSSRLQFKVDILNRKMIVSLRHEYHTAYVNHQMSEKTINFIRDRCLTNTPGEIYHLLKDSKSKDKDSIMQHQVYYQWQQANSSVWQRDPDQFVSASKFLAEKGNKYRYAELKSGNLRGLAVYICETMSVLKSKAKEMVIDATYGTNNSGKASFFIPRQI